MANIYKSIFKIISILAKPLRKKGLYQNKFLLGLFKFICRHFLSDKENKSLVLTKVNNIRMFVNYEDRLSSIPLIFWGKWEEFGLELFTTSIKPGMTIVDIGASNGYYTCVASSHVGPQGKIFAFEPDLESFQLMQKNVILNNINNAVLEQKALSDKKGKIKLYASPNKDSSSIVYSVESKNYFTVNTVTLDDYLKKNRLQSRHH